MILSAVALISEVDMAKDVDAVIRDATPLYEAAKSLLGYWLGVEYHDNRIRSRQHRQMVGRRPDPGRQRQADGRLPAVPVRLPGP